MNTYIRKTTGLVISGIALLLIAGLARADLTGAAVSPAVRSLTVGQNNAVNLQWQIATTVGHSSGGVSAQGTYLNLPSTPIGSRPVALNAVGIGPYVLNEVFVITAAEIDAWVLAGYTQVGYQRLFTDSATGTTAVATATFNINNASLRDIRAPGSELEIKRLELQFPSNLSQLQVVEKEALLQAQVRLSYTGTGLLEGSWQIAEPGSTAGVPVFNTFRVVRQQLSKQQLTVLSSPPLPTDKIGKYILRFCVNGIENSGSTDLTCTGVSVESTYQVIEGQRAPDPLAIKSPEPGFINGETPFAWAPVAEAAVYQLQVHAIVPGEDSVFVTGLMVPGSTNETPLSPLVLSKLKADRAYEWRVNALNGQGYLIAQSDKRTFTYKP